jgi:hypothetical protein
MNPKENELEAMLEKTAEEIRGQSLPLQALEESSQKVWNRIAEASPSIAEFRNCRDFESFIPTYLEVKREGKDITSSSGDPRAAGFLLAEDHLKECNSCRKAYERARQGEKGHTPVRPAVKPGILVRFPIRWKPVLAVAATLLLVAGLSQWNLIYQYFSWDSQALATVKSVDGVIYAVSDHSVLPVTPGTRVGGEQALRTAKDSRATVQLADGSLVELAPRSELKVAKKWSGLGLELAQGQVIVQAAKQHGHMNVTTEDCRVTVIGTVFAVNYGLKGSRVSVVEGKVKVKVAHGKQESLLQSGDQVTTDPSLEKTDISQEFAWSQNAAHYLTLLNELKAVRMDMEQAGLIPGVRYSSRLLPLIPEETMAYVAIPNLSRALGTTFERLQQRVQENETLRSWWQENIGKQGKEEPLKEALAKIQTLGEYLGDEVVICITSGPLLLAEVRRPGEFREVLEKELAKLPLENRDRGKIQILDQPGALAGLTGSSGKEFRILLADGILAASPEIRPLQQVAAALQGQSAGTIANAAFSARLKQAYSEGADWLIGVDMGKAMTRSHHTGAPAEVVSREKGGLQTAGFDNMRYLILEHKEKMGRTENRAAITFDGPRHGLATWLAAPAPMGALTFLSPDTNFVAAFVVKNPAQLLEEVLQLAEKAEPGARQKLEQAEKEKGINLREDLIAPLGGEFLVALDGPALPKPSWKVIFEIYDPARFQTGLQQMVNLANQELAKNGKEPIGLEQVAADGRVCQKIRLSTGTEIFFAAAEGYMIVAPSQVLIQQALQYRQSGSNLPQSTVFRNQLPRDGRQYFSGVIYQNLGPVVKPLTDWAASLGSEKTKWFAELAEKAEPGMVYLYGEEDRILIGSTSSLTAIGLNLGSLMNLERLRKGMEN